MLFRSWLAGTELELTQREWALLSQLVTHTGRVVSRDDVLARWQGNEDKLDAKQDNNALEVYVHRLHKKLEGSDLSIRNVRGLGYMLEKC